jgi:CheY-like chemotaxis protein
MDQGLSSLTVLVVDDNEINRLYLQTLLDRKGHTAIAAASGSEALDAVARQRLDLILLDVQLPDMDGLAVAKAIRAGECGRKNPTDIPILALTAFAMKGDRERCLAAGMTDYLPKPVRAADLLAALARNAARHSGDGNGESAAPDADAPFDLTALADVGRQAFVTEMLDLFLRLADSKGRDLQTAIGQDDLDAAMALAHDLAGMAGPIRALRLHDAMKALQEACASGNPATCRVLHALAGRELRQVVAAVRAYPCRTDAAS